MKDLHHKRKVLSLKVRCSHKAEGCEWEGELGSLEQHLNTDGECGYVDVDCPYACGERGVQRRNMEEHKSQHCPLRPFTCQYCNHKATHQEVTKDHWPVCEKYPLPCPNKCGEEEIERQHLKGHLEQTCQLEVIRCEFNYAGCGAQLQRRLMPAHMKENIADHLIQLSKKVKDMQQDQDKHFDNTKMKTVVLLGRSGQGKTTTGKKLLQLGHYGQSQIEQLCLKNASTEAKSGKHCMFELNTNFITKIRVLEVPSFSEADLLDTPKSCFPVLQDLLKFKRNMSLKFNIILYFLPIRGFLQRVENSLYKELKMINHVLGTAAFEAMVVVATYPPSKRYQQVGFDEEDHKVTSEFFTKAVTSVTGHSFICPIIYIGVDDNEEKVKEMVLSSFHKT